MHSVVVQKTVEIPQLQFLDLVVVPVSCNDKFWYRQCRKMCNCRRCSSCGVVDVIQRNACPQWYMLCVSLRNSFFLREYVDYGS